MMDDGWWMMDDKDEDQDEDADEYEDDDDEDDDDEDDEIGCLTFRPINWGVEYDGVKLG